VDRHVLKKGDIIPNKDVDYSKPCITKFRKLVERNFFKTKTLKYMEELCDRKACIPLIKSLYEFKNTLNMVFDS